MFGKIRKFPKNKLAGCVTRALEYNDANFALIQPVKTAFMMFDY
jgi:hypothetical protein